MEIHLCSPKENINPPITPYSPKEGSELKKEQLKFISF
jgi:hypothetical protein